VKPLVDDWELYSATMKTGRAVRALNAAMNRAAKKLHSELRKRKLRLGDVESIATLIHQLRDSELLPVMRKFAVYGANDSEPYSNAKIGLISAVKDYFGIPRSECHVWEFDL
jgi:hypothetical protein